jgi:hypothetical protein
MFMVLRVLKFHGDALERMCLANVKMVANVWLGFVNFVSVGA